MKEDIKLSKFDNQPWGFRLVGGKDFSTGLTVAKVTVGSLAEAAGLRVGDVLISLNDKPLHNLTHWEAHEVLIQAGNNFVLSVVRNSPAPPQTIQGVAAPPPTPLQTPNIPPMMQTSGPQPNMLQQLPKELSVEEQFEILFKEGQSRNTKTLQQPPQQVNPQLMPQEIPQKNVVGSTQHVGTNMYQHKEFNSHQEYKQQSNVINITAEEAMQNIDQTNQMEQLLSQQQQQQMRPQSPRPQTQQVLSFHQEVPPEDVFTEEYIAEVMSGNAEVIMGKAIGINFNRFKIEPKTDHLAESGAMQLLLEEKERGTLK